jgi:hypothetical protein
MLFDARMPGRRLIMSFGGVRMELICRRGWGLSTRVLTREREVLSRLSKKVSTVSLRKRSLQVLLMTKQWLQSLYVLGLKYVMQSNRSDFVLFYKRSLWLLAHCSGQYVVFGKKGFTNSYNNNLEFYEVLSHWRNNIIGIRKLPTKRYSLVSKDTVRP